MKIVALMPAYKYMEIPAVKSLVAMQADIYNRGDNVNIAFVHGFNTVIARNNLFKYAAQCDGVDYVINLDSDHIYKAEDIYTLIDRLESNKLDMLSAGYFLKDGKSFVHGRHIDGKFVKYNKGEVSGIVDCDVLGFGFLLMKWQFVKDMVDRYPQDLFKMDVGDNATEDVYFCRKAKEFGARICFDADTIVGHLATMVIR